MSWWTVLKYTVLGIFMGVEWVEEHRRTHAIRTLARNLQLTFLGKRSLPEALALYGTPFAAVNGYTVSNLIDGQLGGIRVIVFDCENIADKGIWQRTVIAARTDKDVFAAAKLNFKLAQDHSARWAILYAPFGAPVADLSLMPVAELEAIVTAIRA